MPQNFIECDREQAMLMPPSLLDWVPEDHLVWTILQSVSEMDLDALYGVYRRDGHGRPAYHPAMMVALLLYAYSKGNRSARAIERECQEDVAYMVISAQRAPDHSTIAEFRRRHETALADLFTGVLRPCREAGLVRVGVVVIDGTKVSANASRDANKSYRRIVHEILEEAEDIDRAEDEQHGDRRGDELPEEMQRGAVRRCGPRSSGWTATSTRAVAVIAIAPRVRALQRPTARGLPSRRWSSMRRRSLRARMAVMAGCRTPGGSWRPAVSRTRDRSRGHAAVGCFSQPGG